MPSHYPTPANPQAAARYLDGVTNKVTEFCDAMFLTDLGDAYDPDPSAPTAIESDTRRRTDSEETSVYSGMLESTVGDLMFGPDDSLANPGKRFNRDDIGMRVGRSILSSMFVKAVRVDNLPVTPEAADQMEQTELAGLQLATTRIISLGITYVQRHHAATVAFNLKTDSRTPYRTPLVARTVRSTLDDSARYQTHPPLVRPARSFDEVAELVRIGYLLGRPDPLPNGRLVT